MKGGGGGGGTRNNGGGGGGGHNSSNSLSLSLDSRVSLASPSSYKTQYVECSNYVWHDPF